MRRVLFWLLLLLPLAAGAAHDGDPRNVVPVGVWVPVTRFVGAEVPFVRVDFPAAQIPGNVVRIVGWSGWVYPTAPLPLYVEVRLWHDGGTPHLLDTVLFSFSPDDAVIGRSHAVKAIPWSMLPEPGHHMAAGDQLFLEFRCPGKSATSAAACEIAMTVQLRVGP
jgi:hypothetical protein